jgi:DNA modification methylase
MDTSANLTWKSERRRLGELIPRPDNPRTMAEAQAQRLIASYLKFGQPLPLLMNSDGTLNDGHQRLREWIAEFGADFEVDVRIPSRSLSRREWQELVVTLHEGATGEWDFDALAGWDGVDVGDLKEWGFSEAALGLAGFEFGEDESGPAPVAQVDKAEELQEKWQVRLGDVWSIGEHRLACGDCTDVAVVEAVMRGEMADAVVTDPPYGVIDAEWDRYPEQLDYDLWVSVCDGPIMAFGAASTHCVKALLSIEPLAERIYIWWNTFTLTHSEGAFWQWQPIYVWRRSLVSGLERDVIQMAANTGGDKLVHITQKPTALIEKLLLSCEGAIVVYDPFAGSGTTGVACERLGRAARMIELHPPYCAATLERMAAMGLQPAILTKG